MSDAIRVGKSESRTVSLDLMTLVGTRMLLQANSGGGKSWLIRLICEKAAGQLPIIVLDPEGEFATLREKHDMVLVGPNGEIPADPKNAKSMARRLVELNVSAVIDISELDRGPQRQFVRYFCEALIGLPRKLWRPLMIMLDEAHVFCPERSSGQAESTDAVIGLLSRGRKRGMGTVLATQRLSKLHKDAAAECGNVCIGRTTLDLDRARAGDVFGMTKQERRVFGQLKPGEWFAIGSAFDRPSDVIRFHADKVKTTHPKSGERGQLKVPQPSKAIQSVAKELADMATKEGEVYDIDTARLEINNLRMKLKRAEKQSAPPDQDVIDRAVTKATGQMRRELESAEQEYGNQLRQIQQRAEGIARDATWIAGKEQIEARAPKLRAAEAITVRPDRAVSRPAPKRGTIPAPVDGEYKPSKAEGKILAALFHYPDGKNKRSLGVLTGYSWKGGGFGNALSSLRSKGLIEGSGHLKLTDAAEPYVADLESLPTGTDLQAYWLNELSKCEREVLTVLLGVYPDVLDKEAIAAETESQYEPRGGGFGNALSKLRALELIEGRGEMKATDVFFEE